MPEIPSLSSLPAAVSQLPAIPGAAGAVLVVAAVVAFGVREAWVHHLKHISDELLKDSLEYNKLAKQCLKGGRVLEVEFLKLESIEFPDPFHVDNEDKPTEAYSNNCTPEFLEDIEDLTPTYPDPHLAPCFRSYLNSLNYLEELLDVEVSGNARGVIVFIMLMIAVHCINFTGAEKNIAYTHQMAEFVNRVASKHRPGKSPTDAEKKRFEHLTLVYGELKNAEILLVEHINKRSHEELISTNVPFVANLAEKMIKNFVKYTVKEEFYGAIKSTTMQRLAINVVKPKFQYDRGFFSRLLRAPRAIGLKESPFQKWIDDCARNFLLAENIACGKVKDDFPVSSVPYIERHKRYTKKAMDVLKLHQNTLLTEHQYKILSNLRYFSVGELEELKDKLLTEADFISLVDKGYFSQKTIDDLTKRGMREGVFKNSYLSKHELEELEHVKMFTGMLMKELEPFKKTTFTSAHLHVLESEYFTEWEMDQLRELNKENNNFLTLQPVINGVLAATTFEPVHDDAVIIERAKFMSDYAGLINKVTLLEHFEFYLWNRVKELGEIYISDPHHCNFIFGVLSGVAAQVDKDARAFLSRINDMEHDLDRARAMHPAERLVVINQTKKFVGRVSSDIAVKVKEIAARHERRSPNAEATGEIDIEKDKMYKLGADIVSALNLEVSHRLMKGSEHSGLSIGSAIEEMKADHDFFVTTPSNILHGGLHHPVLDQHLPSNFDPHKEEGVITIVAPDAKVEEHEPLNKDVSMQELLLKLQIIQAQMLQLPRGSQRNYCLALYNAFNHLRTHIEGLEREDRHEKAGDLRCALMNVLDDTGTFLEANKSPDRKVRREAAEDFSRNVHESLHSAPYSDSIDTHLSLISRLVAEIISCALLFGFVKLYQRGGLLRTESRVETNNIESLCVSIKNAAPAA